MSEEILSTTQQQARASTSNENLNSTPQHRRPYEPPAREEALSRATRQGPSLTNDGPSFS